MAITSHAFGRVTLTHDDADKFANQVRYGRPSKTAKAAVSRGLEIAKAVQGNGKFSFSVTRPERVKAPVVKKD